jgi:hypothetical protein
LQHTIDGPTAQLQLAAATYCNFSHLFSNFPGQRRTHGKNKEAQVSFAVVGISSTPFPLITNIGKASPWSTERIKNP